ncbi:MAG: hypothetical protein JWP87_5091 [Labilithrix sp.]|nr:hypothetical protein [Labilithrix sp.]
MKTELTKSNEQTPARRAEEQRLAIRPRVDVFENEREYLVVADVPGVAKDAIDVRFEDGELRLEARRWTQANTDQPLSAEYHVADYRRAFAMPDGVDADKIEAELKSGVLEVHLPKSEAKRPRRIDIRAS